MQLKSAFKGYRINEAFIRFNVPEKDQTFKISPHFECKMTGNEENFSATLTVVINEKFSGGKTPFDLQATIIGFFAIGNDLSGDKKGQLRFALDTLFPYVRAFVTSLTTSCAMPPFILPFVDVDGMVAAMRPEGELPN
ncbi:MAG: protein-export chaperone SecB [Clostridia bacterium]|nr:protein-export chaperone SecB [Clostridia bacterium]